MVYGEALCRLDLFSGSFVALVVSSSGDGVIVSGRIATTSKIEAIIIGRGGGGRSAVTALQ